MKILAVDDDPLSLELLSAAMASVGYADVERARTAEEALCKVASSPQRFGCVLVDIQMPGTDGIQFCRRLREVPGYSETPVIMVTALSARPYLSRAFAAGATDYVTKPFDLTELGARVRQAERQVRANEIALRSAAAVAALRAELEETRRVGFDSAVALSDVHGAVDYLALENYLLRLSRGDLIGTSLFAFQILDLERLHQSVHPSVFIDLLSDVADAILEAFCGNDCLLAYAGGGTIATVVSGGFGIDPEEISASVNQAAEELSMLDGHGRRFDVTVVAGAPEHLGVMTTGRAAVNALRLAVDRARVSSAVQGRPMLPARRGGVGLIGTLLKAV